MTITIDQFVQREVGHCVSSLVSTLAQGYGSVELGISRIGREWRENMASLTEQAFELASPIPDYMAAAWEAGWEGPHKDQFGATYFQDETDGATWACGSWAELCAAQDIEPIDCEVYEHWLVSNWLAEKLEAKGEKVDKDFAGLTVWARTTTGQSITIDSVIEAIYTDLIA